VDHGRLAVTVLVRRLAVAPTVPLTSARARPLALVGVLGGAVVIAVAIAIVPDSALVRVLASSIGLMLAAAALVVLPFQTLVRPGEVRVRASDGGTAFVPPRWAGAGWTVVYLLGLLPAVLVAAFGIPLPDLRSTLIVGFFALVAVAGIAQRLLGLRRPEGLRMTDTGLTGVRGSSVVDIPWDALAAATVTSGRAGALLTLVRTDGARVSVEPRWTGSDPHAVAAALEFFLDRPERRNLLTDPERALDAVDTES
jgi:hypothetical protein